MKHKNEITPTNDLMKLLIGNQAYSLKVMVDLSTFCI